MARSHPNRLIVTGLAYRIGKRRYVNCSCECGGECVLRSDHVNIKRHCGCLDQLNSGKANRSHGMSDSKEYWAWVQMRERCYNPKHVMYHNYGAKGITVCQEWLESFSSFFEHVGLAPSREYSIDRINFLGNYEPGNVRWATRVQQARNTCRNVVLEVDGVSRTVAEWAELSGLPYHVVANRARSGWAPEDAVRMPLDVKRSHSPKNKKES